MSRINPDVDIYDLTLPKQDVIKVDIVPDIQPPQELIPELFQSRKRLGVILWAKALVPVNMHCGITQSAGLFCAYAVYCSQCSEWSIFCSERYE